MTNEKKCHISTNVIAEAMVKTNEIGTKNAISVRSYSGLKIDKISKIITLIKFKITKATMSFCFKKVQPYLQ